MHEQYLSPLKVTRHKIFLDESGWMQTDLGTQNLFLCLA